MPPPYVWGVVLTGGTSTTGRLVGSVASKYACSLLRGGNGCRWSSAGRLGTLLGPEGTATWWVLPWSGPSGPVYRCWSSSLRGWRVVVGAGCEGGGRWLLENCTVDASIFE